MAVQQLVVFNINNEDLGVEITQVKEIINPLEIFKVPNTSDFIEGLIDLRGKVHTIINLRKKFNLPAREFDESTKIMIVNINSLSVGFIVDEVNEILRVDEENIEDVSKSASNLNKKYLSGVAKSGERIVLVLDLAKILSVEEEELIGKL